MTDIAPVDCDPHAERIAADANAGRLTVAQAVRLAMATGRLQGCYMGAIQLAHEAALVCEANRGRMVKSEAESVRSDTGEEVAKARQGRLIQWLLAHTRVFRSYSKGLRR